MPPLVYHRLRAVRQEHGLTYVTVEIDGQMQEFKTRDATIGHFAQQACADGVPVHLDTRGPWLNGVHPDYRRQGDVFLAEFGISHEQIQRAE